MKKFLTIFLLTGVILSFAAPPSFAQKQANDWNELGNYLNREVAVKTKTGGTKYGILKTAGASEIKVQIVGKKNLTATETTFRRDEIEKIWSARLRYGGRNIGKGALIGAGAGAAIGLVYVATAKPDPQTGPDGQVGVAVPFLALTGAAIGGVVGIFSRKSHKKVSLIYKN